jgi:hypothetical protein
MVSGAVFMKNQVGIFSRRVLCVAVATIMLLCGTIVVRAEPMGSSTKNIMVTGYWAPTGDMVRHFCNNTTVNPGGWDGGNWEGLGYNVSSYFPLHPPGYDQGPFQVDYQNTRTDFENVTNTLHPAAIISFGAGAGPWEIECNARNLGSWINDYVAPMQPTPCPPDGTKSVGYTRHSSLPVSTIREAVNGNTTINAWVDYGGDMGAFLCEFMGYMGMWYHDDHNTSGDSYRCYAAGFVHVQNSLPLLECMKAANITIGETIKYIDSLTVPEMPVIIGACMVMPIVAIAVRAGRKKQPD